ncbi:MAG: hypothetical protein ACT4PP_05575 [Sporichthyaceae bacterium]
MDTIRVVKMIDEVSPKSCAKLNSVALVYSVPGRTMCALTLA